MNIVAPAAGESGQRYESRSDASRNCAFALPSTHARWRSLACGGLFIGTVSASVTQASQGCRWFELTGCLGCRTRSGTRVSVGLPLEAVLRTLAIENLLTCAGARYWQCVVHCWRFPWWRYSFAERGGFSRTPAAWPYRLATMLGAQLRDGSVRERGGGGRDTAVGFGRSAYAWSAGTRMIRVASAPALCAFVATTTGIDARGCVFGWHTVNCSTLRKREREGDVYGMAHCQLRRRYCRGVRRLRRDLFDVKSRYAVCSGERSADRARRQHTAWGNPAMAINATALIAGSRLTSGGFGAVAVPGSLNFPTSDVTFSTIPSAESERDSSKRLAIAMVAEGCPAQCRLGERFVSMIWPGMGCMLDMADAAGTAAVLDVRATAQQGVLREQHIRRDRGEGGLCWLSQAVVSGVKHTTSRQPRADEVTPGFLASRPSGIARQMKGNASVARDSAF